jgi:hypothetical protein
MSHQPLSAGQGISQLKLRGVRAAYYVLPRTPAAGRLKLQGSELTTTSYSSDGPLKPLWPLKLKGFMACHEFPALGQLKLNTVHPGYYHIFESLGGSCGLVAGSLSHQSSRPWRARESGKIAGMRI